jgi:hypothetical protein
MKTEKGAVCKFGDATGSPSGRIGNVRAGLAPATCLILGPAVNFWGNPWQKKDAVKTASFHDFP